MIAKLKLINDLRISRGGPEDEGMLWWDLQKGISILSSPLALHQMHLGIEDLSMLALHFDKRGIEIIEYIQKCIFDQTVRTFCRQQERKNDILKVYQLRKSSGVE